MHARTTHKTSRGRRTLRPIAFPHEDGGALAEFLKANPTVKHRLSKMDEYNRFQVNFTTPPNASYPLGTAGTVHCIS